MTRSPGTSGDDVIAGLGGDDGIQGRGGNDVICGGEGLDIIEGGRGDDLIIGGRVEDGLYGGAGDDVIRGGSNEDLEGLTAACFWMVFGGRQVTTRSLVRRATTYWSGETVTTSSTEVPTPTV